MTSSLLPATSTTSNLPSVTSMTTNLPPTTFTTSNLPPANSFTSQLPSATLTTSNLPTTTSLTSHLPLVTSLTSHLHPSISTAMAYNINESDLFVVLVIKEVNLLIEAEKEEVDDVTMNEEVEGNVNLEPGNHNESYMIQQEVLDFRMFNSAPKLHTKLTIEIHACKVYTRTISLLVQKEIYEGCWACKIQEFKKDEGCEIVKVRDIRAGAYRTIYKEEGKETVIQEKDKVVDYKVVRNPKDGSVECTCRRFLRYGFLCRHVFCVLKNCNIEIIQERYILRRWRMDLIPSALRRNTNRYGEKDEAIEKLTNEANFVVDECLFLLRKDKEQLKQFVENLENIKKEIQIKVPNHPSQKTGDVIEDIYAIKKPKQNLVNNPQKARNKGGRRGERIKSGREIAMKAKAKRARKCGYCAEKTNKHTKTTCPLNPKYIVKLATIETAAEQERRTATSATEQDERNSDSTRIADKEQSNTAS
nr:hypothetical protein [Tanacetum cinerariifolium]